MLEQHKIEDVSRYGDGSPFSGALAVAFRRHLARVIPPEARWNWPHLLETTAFAKAGPREAERAVFVLAIRRLRDCGCLDDCFVRDPNRKWMGSPGIFWRNPKGDDLPDWRPAEPDPSQF